MPAFTHGSLAHFDIAGSNAPALTAFYEAVLGWQITPRGEGYATIETPDGGPNGAIMEAEQSAITMGIAVADLADALARAEQAGGRIVMPETDNGWVKKAQIADVSGNVVTLIQI